VTQGANILSLRYAITCGIPLRDQLVLEVPRRANKLLIRGCLPRVRGEAILSAAMEDRFSQLGRHPERLAIPSQSFRIPLPSARIPVNCKRQRNHTVGVESAVLRK